MDYEQKGTDIYKEHQSDRVLFAGEFGDCSKIPVSWPVKRAKGVGIFDGARGISVVGLQTNIALPNMDVTIDAGSNADKVLERNLVISHYDADHVEGVGRAICNAINRKSKLDIFLPNLKDHAKMKVSLSAFLGNDKEGFVKVHEMDPGAKASSSTLKVESFKTNHSPESMGFILSQRDGDGWKEKLVYTGDIDLSKEQIGKDHPINKAESLIIDGSYSGIVSIFNDFLDLFTSHTSTGEIDDAIKKNGNLKNIGIVHVPLVACYDIESDISSRFGDKKVNVFLLKSCINALFDSPLDRFSTFERIGRN